MYIVVDHLLSRVQLFVTPWTAAQQAFLSFTLSLNLLKLNSMSDDAIHPSDPLLSSSPPALNLSQHQHLHIYFAQLLSCV